MKSFDDAISVVGGVRGTTSQTLRIIQLVIAVVFSVLPTVVLNAAVSLNVVGHFSSIEVRYSKQPCVGSGVRVYGHPLPC